MVDSKLITPHQKLRSLFELNINATHISEKIQLCDSDDDITKAKSIMDKYDFDCIGVKENNKVIGYIEGQEVKEADGTCEDYVRKFDTSEIISNTTSLIQTLYLLNDFDRLFILEGNKVEKLVTRADLQKSPVKLLLFGLISLVETYLLELIKENYPHNEWQQCITDDRLMEAKKLFEKRRSLNEEMELLDCLQLCDKRDILMENKELYGKLFESKAKGTRFLRELEDLRNHIAHAREYTRNFTASQIMSIAKRSEDFLSRYEKTRV